MAQQSNRNTHGEYKDLDLSEAAGGTSALASSMDNDGMSDGVDLSSQTPVEIDTALADLYMQENRAQRSVDGTVERLLSAVQPNHWSRKVPTMKPAEVLAEAKRCVDDETIAPYKRENLSGLLTKLDADQSEVARLSAESDVLDDEFDRRGRWTRAFLVDNTNGHVHSSMNCSTCHPTTRYAWMTDYSGGTEEAVVEDAGKRACTVCYPSAPVDTLNRPTKMFTESEKTAAVEREDRAVAKVEREAKRLEKALLPSGEPLRVPTWQDHNGRTHYDDFKSLVAARTRLTDFHEEWRKSPSQYDIEAKQMLAEAIAAKEGKTVDVVLAEAQVRAAKRK